MTTAFALGALGALLLTSPLLLSYRRDALRYWHEIEQEPARQEGCKEAAPARRPKPATSLL